MKGGQIKMEIVSILESSLLMITPIPYLNEVTTTFLVLHLIPRLMTLALEDIENFSTNRGRLLRVNNEFAYYFGIKGSPHYIFSL